MGLEGFSGFGRMFSRMFSGLGCGCLGCLGCLGSASALFPFKTPDSEYLRIMEVFFVKPGGVHRSI